MAEYYLKRSEQSTGEAEEDDMLLNFIKKRKLCSDVISLENSVSSAESVAYGCSSADDGDESSGVVAESVVESPDLEDFVDMQCESVENEISMAINYSRIGHETRGDSEQSSLESTPHAASPHRISTSSTAGRSPSAEEIEEFFAAVEEYEQKRFAEKYNYDIAKDVPLEGKYEWVPLHP
ncbi:Cyclin-dependent kinase inhibitor family protein [Dorcoceras hygrometricum]|uniref:Cyclin-dependent kinase inhibitor family protein n=1 Tax=Dorcoceras hygrometricum TaxID=472368 RepID=A0A2Z7BUV3_9LAMI|nr:Cyclin-dependent kinase inhibitor family protein [Dorcoceras hygrometricum]